MKRYRWPVAYMHCWYVDGAMTIQEIAGRLSGSKWEEWWSIQGIPGYQPSHKVVNKVLLRHKVPLRKTGAVGSRNGSWTGGEILDKSGYVLKLQRDHPNANSGGYVRLHRLVVESHLGRYLDRNEVVHHKDNNKQNNNLDNLELFSSNSKHISDTFGGHTRDNSAAVAKRRESLDRWWDLAKVLIVEWYTVDMLTLTQIAELLGMRPSTIRQRLRKFGLDTKRRNGADVREIKERHRFAASLILETPHPDKGTCVPKCK